MVHRFFAFTLCATVGWCLYFSIETWSNTAANIDPVFIDISDVSEISMVVDLAWCGGHRNCNYWFTFRREGRDDYTSSVSGRGILTGELRTGDITRAEFDRLVRVLKSNSFFDLAKRYPEDAWCTDCTIVTLSAIRAGRRKEVKVLSDEVPLPLWTVKRTIQGTIMNVRWSNECSKLIPIFR